MKTVTSPVDDKPTQTAGALTVHTANPEADLTVAAGRTNPDKARLNGAAQAPAQERSLRVVAIVDHLHHDPAGFLSDLANIMDDERTRLLKIPESKRRAALAKISRSMGLRIVEQQPPAPPDTTK